MEGKNDIKAPHLVKIYIKKYISLPWEMAILGSIHQTPLSPQRWKTMTTSHWHSHRRQWRKTSDRRRCSSPWRTALNRHTWRRMALAAGSGWPLPSVCRARNGPDTLAGVALILQTDLKTLPMHEVTTRAPIPGHNSNVNFQAG